MFLFILIVFSLHMNAPIIVLSWIKITTYISLLYSFILTHDSQHSKCLRDKCLGYSNKTCSTHTNVSFMYSELFFCIFYAISTFWLAIEPTTKSFMLTNNDISLKLSFWQAPYWWRHSCVCHDSLAANNLFRHHHRSQKQNIIVVCFLQKNLTGP